MIYECWMTSEDDDTPRHHLNIEEDCTYIEAIADYYAMRLDRIDNKVLTDSSKDYFVFVKSPDGKITKCDCHVWYDKMFSVTEHEEE